MTESAWDPVEDVRKIVCLFVPVSGRPSWLVLYDNDSCLSPTPLLRTLRKVTPVETSCRIYFVTFEVF